MTEIPKVYEPKNVEQKWYSYWMEKGYFHAEDVSDKPPYSIVIPPPNITGPLHKGHAVPMTIQDILIRWKRMQGYNTLWMPGTDHAGISANAVVDRQLRQQGIDRFQLGREKFIEKMWEWKHYIHKIIINGLHRLGCSCDWERERFTMDEGLSRAVTETFVRLYNKGLIYRSQYIVNWCPRDRTTLSNLEVDYKEQKTSLYYIKYPFVDGEGGIVVATTRPETMLGDTAVAVHPSDERYKNYIGKKVILPIVNREIPIIADALHVDPEFGTGAVKITPGHDFNDFEVAQRHNIPSINVMNEDATMNENAGKFNGMDRFECRKALLKELEENGYLVKIEEHDYMLGKCSKCDTIVEPRLSLQWFVKMKPLAEPAIKAVESGEIRIIPENWTKIYYEWMYNIRDWPISRQIWWGHQIPVWYCKDCDEMIVATSTPEKCKCGSTNLEQDPDVLDTWFSSGLWPFSTLGWPEETQAYKTFYPTSALVTAWDILFFWVARMIFQGISCTGKKPFSDVYLHPLIADPETGTKMSKSKGNVQDLLDDIEKYGTDAFRFAIAASIIPSSYMMLPDSRIQGYRNFANKLWNASRFVLMNLDGIDTNPSSVRLELCDKWILSRYNSVIQEVTNALDSYRFNDAAQVLYDFIWHEYCDWYLELAKIRIYDKEDTIGRQTAQYIVWKVLEGTLRLLHPIMPFITEEIWQHLPHEGESIMIAPWPKPEKDFINKNLEEDMTIIMDIIRAVRNILSEMNVPPSKKAEILIQASNDGVKNLLLENINYIYRLANGAKVIVEPSIQKPSSSATAVIGDIEVFVPLAGLIDVEKEKERLTKNLEKAISDLERISTRLSDESFLSKAPENIIAKERERKAEIEALRIKLEKNLEMLGN